MSVKVFRSDRQPDSELAYREWLRDNPEGFVVNLLKKTSGQASKRETNVLPGFTEPNVKLSIRC